MAASGWHSIISGVLGVWRGPSSIAMLGAASSHMAWLTQAALHAEVTASQAQMASAMYETARAAMIPLPVVTANRIQLAVLVASNILGQNSAAIATNEAQYAAMWAQDVVVMGAYQVGSAASTAGLPQIVPAIPAGNPASAVTVVPTVTTNSIGSILSGVLGSGFFGTTFQSFISSGLLGEIPIGLLGLLPLFGISSGVGSIANEISTGLHVAAPIIPTVPKPSVAPGARVSVGIGRPLGGLGMSVPPSWASAAQPNSTIERPLVRPVKPGQGFIPAPIPTAISARQAAKAKKGNSPELLATARFVPRPLPGG